MSLTAELADGRVLEFPDGTDPAVVQATVKKMVAPPSIPQRIGRNIAGTMEAGMALGSGALAAPVAGLAGLAQGAKNLVSPGMSAGDRVNQVQGAMTYEPTTQAGRTLTGAVAYPFEKLAEGADYVGGAAAEATGSPAIGASINTALQSAPALVARGVKAPVQQALARSGAEAQAMARRNSVRDTTIADARAEGYVLQPTEAKRGGTFLEKRMEGVGGKAALNQEVQLRNQEVTNRIAREESGLPVDGPITEGALAAARDRLSQPYREVAAIDPHAASILEQLKQARADSKGWWKFYDHTPNPRYKTKAESLDTKAAALEQYLDQIAVNAGKPDLVTQLREARTNLAKNYDVDRALNKGSGDVDARVIGNILDSRGTAAVSGGLRTIGRFANAATRAVREGGPMPTPGKGESAFGVLAGMGGHASGMGWLPMGLPLLAGPARSVLLSPAMQGARTYGPGAGISGLEALLRNPEPLTIGGPTIGNNEGLAALLRR